MHCHWLAQRGRAFHSFAQGLVVGAWKIFDAAVGHEGLKPNDPALCQFAEILEVAWCQAAPKCEIDNRFGLGRRPLLIKACPVQRRWMSVKRHVEEDRSASGGQGHGTCFYSF